MKIQIFLICPSTNEHDTRLWLLMTAALLILLLPEGSDLWPCALLDGHAELDWGGVGSRSANYSIAGTRARGAPECSASGMEFH